MNFTEALKVLPATNYFTSFSYHVEIKCLAKAIGCLKFERVFVCVNMIMIGSLCCIKSCMGSFINFFDTSYADVVWQKRIKLIAKISSVDFCVAVKVGYLLCSMNSSICSATSYDGNLCF